MGIVGFRQKIKDMLRDIHADAEDVNKEASSNKEQM